MKALQWFIRGVLFLFILSFSLRNTQAVSVELLPGYTVLQPLIVILLLTLIVGITVAWLLLLPSWLKARRIVNQSSLQSTTNTTSVEKDNGI